MDFKKILAIAVILVALGMTLTAISASDIEKVDIGDITKSNIHENSFDSAKSEANFTAKIEIDISDLSMFDKPALEEAINNKNDTTFILNLTTEVGNVTITNFQGLYDAYIKDNTLYVEFTHTMDTFGASISDSNITAVSFKTGDGKLYTTLDD